MTAIRLSQVHFTYRDAEQPALAGIDLPVRTAEFVVILGPSGAGKSTLCYTLNGLVPKFLRGKLQGEVLVFGRTTRSDKVSALSEDVGMVFQDFKSQLFSTNVELEVAFAPENFGVDRREIARRIRESLAIASVLSLQPKIIVMDEPTTDLDPLGKEGGFSVSRKLRERGMTLIIAEHETEKAAVADRVVVLQAGRVVADGPPEQVLCRAGWLEEIGVQPLGATQLTDRLGLPPALTVAEAVESLAAASC